MARPRMCYEMSTFIEDCLQQSNWGNVSLVMTTSHLVLMRFDGNIYVLPLVLIDQIVIYLNRLTIKIYVSLKDDLSKSLLQASGLRPKSISSIEYGFSRLQNTETMAQEFFTGISTIRRNPAAEITPDLIAELNLILNYESKIYKVVEEQGGFFNEKRAYFLKGLSKINRILAQNFEGMPYVKLKNLLWNSCILPDTVMMISGDEFSARNQLGGPTFMGSNKRHFVASTNPYFIYHIVINIMIITGLLKQTRRNTSIYI